MITAPTQCFFTAKVVGEAASAVVGEISPGAAADITEVTLVSDDFDSDITALNALSENVELVEKLFSSTLKVTETFNPLYIPSGIESVDELLDINMRSEAMRFTGFGGNPYTLKLVDLRNGDEKLATFSAQYHPFELPPYNDIVEAHEHFRPN